MGNADAGFAGRLNGPFRPAIAIIEVMQESGTTVSRPLVGFLIIALFGVAFSLSLWPNLFPGAAGAALAGATARVGIVMVALWLALPTRNRPAAWAKVSSAWTVPVVLATLALFRVPFRLLIPLAGLLLVTGLVLRPRPLRRPERRVD